MMKMNTYEILLEVLKEDIENDNLAQLEINLLRLPFGEMNQQLVDKTLSYLINLTVIYNNQKSIKLIFDYWYQMLDVANGQLDHLTRLFCDITVSMEALRLVANTYKDEKSVEYYFSHLIDYDSAPMTMIGAKNLEIIFSDTDNTTWQYLFDVSVENELKKGYTNHLIKEFLEVKIVDTAKPIDKPAWIINDYPTVPSYDALKLEMAKEYVFQPTGNLRPLTDNIEINALEVYNLANTEKRENITDAVSLSMFRYNLNFDTKLFKVFGPINTQMNENLLIEDICHIYGGCRMFCCVEYEDQFVSDESVDSFDTDYNNDAFEKTFWFTGVCDTCLNKIKWMHYAVRLPLYNGGFQGCYCSWKCVRDTLLPSEFIVAELINIFEKQMMEIGIQDRNYLQ